MALGSTTERVVTKAIEEGGYLRGSGLRLGDEAGHKEWLHFCVSNDDLDLLLNFSVVDEIGATLEAPREAARVTCLLHADGAWSGDMLKLGTRSVSVRRGFLSLQMGDCCVHFANGVFHVRAVLKAQGIALELLLTPLTIPTPANNIALEGSPPMHWFAVPRLRVDGWIRTPKKVYALEGARGYHDHNWGAFRWGRNFAWQWGYALPERHDDPFSFVFLRLTDRARTTTLMQALFIWRAERQHRVFRDEGLSVETEGMLACPAPLKIPRVMGLLVPGSASDVPQRLTLKGAARGDTLNITYRFDDVAQVITPNDDDLGSTVINEVRGRYECEGTIRGERLQSRGRAIVEFLSH